MEFKFDYDYIEKLTQTNGISGHEGAVAKLMHDELKDLCDEVLFDNLGSIIFVKKGPENAPKVMISAHLDQIGFIIADIDDKGFAFIKPIGGWWPAQLMTQD
ncbi:MAG: M42 family peptidase, partial [Niameybacter sp.]